MRTTDFDFELPPERIAAVPAPRRDGSRLLLMDRLNGSRKHEHFQNLPRLLPPRSLVVLNDTRVIAARLRARKPTGGAVEFLLTRSVHRTLEAGGVVETWEALARGLGRSPDHAGGPVFTIGPRLTATVVESRGEGRVLLRLHALGVSSVLEVLDELGEIPLPPYIEAARKSSGAGGPAVDDRQRYQTVYAAAPGAVAAPTAGLHFTPALLDQVRDAGHEVVTVTLHVGPGTFRPVKAEDPRQHELDEERYSIPPATAGAVERAREAGRPVVAVGTTVVRALEASARGHAGRVVAGDAATTLFILPGDRFQVVSGLVTNFHLPRSSLLMLVAAFAGRDPVLAAYREAVACEYRFYSYGDAMLICETAW